jgi:hypothetical protein
VVEAEAVEVFLEAVRLFNRVEVRALDVLGQGGFEDLLVIEIDDADRHLGQAGLLGGAEAALARDQLEALADLPHHQRLQDAVGPHAGAERFQLVGVERLARLIGIVLDAVERDFGHLGQRGVAADQGVQPAAQAFLLHDDILVSDDGVPVSARDDSKMPRPEQPALPAPTFRAEHPAQGTGGRRQGTTCTFFLRNDCVKIPPLR